jgi:hypothetical protein
MRKAGNTGSPPVYADIDCPHFQLLSGGVGTSLRALVKGDQVNQLATGRRPVCARLFCCLRREIWPGGSRRVAVGGGAAGATGKGPPSLTLKNNPPRDPITVAQVCLYYLSWRSNHWVVTRMGKAGKPGSPAFHADKRRPTCGSQFEARGKSRRFLLCRPGARDPRPRAVARAREAFFAARGERHLV